MKASRFPTLMVLLLLCLAAIPAAALAAPDLVVATFEPPSGPVERTFAIPSAVRNAGTSGTGVGFTAAFVLSSDTAFTLDDTVIGERSFAALAAGATSQTRSTNVTIPGTVPGGTYYLAMAVDTGLAVAESNELNNLMADPDPVVVPALPAPDLGPGHFAVSRGTTAVEYVVNASVRNDGTAPAGAFDVEFYLSSDTVITTADACIHQQSYPGLAAGGEQDVSSSPNIQSDVPAGTYYLGMVVDAGSTVGESNEANNTAYAPGQVALQDLPDLAVWEFSSPHGAVPRTFHVYNSVWNPGRTAAGPFTAGFYLSSDTVVTTADTLIGTRSFGGATPGYKWPREDTTVTVPASVPGGAYYVGMIIDPAGVVAEGMEANNVVYDGAGVVVPASPAPDLGGDIFGAEPGWVARSFWVRGWVLNYGDAPAGACTVGYYLSADTAITTADTLLGTDACGPLAPGAESYIDELLTVPLTVPAGTYYLGMVVDPGDVVAESREGNNAICDPAPEVVSDLPDLVPSTFEPPRGASSRTFEVSSAVTNYGATPAPPFSAGFYLSTDMEITTADVLIGTRAFGGLPALGAAPVENTTLTVSPSVPAGLYYVGMIADQGNAVAEAVEGNNVAFHSEGQVTIPAAVLAPDLGIMSFQVYGTAAFKLYDFRCTARNFGLAPTGPFSVAYYLSVDRDITLSDTLLGVSQIDDLAPGATADLPRFWTVPASVPAGAYYLGVVLDPTNAVAESNETNNTASDPVSISSLPDLALNGLSVPGGVTARTFVIGSVFRNAGMTDAGPFQVEFYLSADKTVTRGDVLLGTRSHGGLAAGAVGPPGNTTATVPAGVPGGPYYLGTIIDPADAVAEAIEGNNVLRTVDTITVPMAVVPVPPSALPPTDTDGDRIYDDVNGNGRPDFADVVLYFNQMDWIARYEPVSAFDCNGNGRVDFADVVWLFNRL